MKNLQTLSNNELNSINGGCQFDPCPKPFGGPIIIIDPKEDPIPFGDPRDQDHQFPFHI
ncbi:bacteriocin [Aquimarina sp. AD10]|uniref:bacteriocin n=1 Tax=Aquimarina sp. AD10 TaxID=1714849 RepID=UPI000E5248CB|nr:bacteriocin [Aquimarina sp. AD10]AXT62163.1 bacteriocin [Aquimarina sp. AD10]RKM90642.1 bacteriocin [Aquimarina sp. AD10]